MEIQKYLVGKNYIKSGRVNPSFNKELNDIVFFLAINTIYKKTLVFDDCAHLMDILPSLSKCLLLNIVYGLDLCQSFSLTIEKLPLHICTELLDEAIHCLKKSIPKVHLQNASMFLKSAAIKLDATEYNVQVSYNVEISCENHLLIAT